MSSGQASPEVRILRAEVEVLRASLEALQIRVEELEARGEVRSEVERSFRSDRLEGAERRSLAEESASSVSARSAGTWSKVTDPVLVGDHTARADLARQIGQFLDRALRGDFRGSSGRDRLQLGNRYYIILKNFEGERLPEPLVVSSFSEVRRLCKRGSECGASLFVGLATQWEARLALEEARLPVPPSLRHG